MNFCWAVIRHISRLVSCIHGVGTNDIDAQMSGITFWKGDENLRLVYKNRLRNIKWFISFLTF